MFSLFSDQCEEDTRRPEESLSRRLPLLEDRRSRWDCPAAGLGLCRRHNRLGSGSGWWKYSMLVTLSGELMGSTTAEDGKGGHSMRVLTLMVQTVQVAATWLIPHLLKILLMTVQSGIQPYNTVIWGNKHMEMVDQSIK